MHAVTRHAAWSLPKSQLRSSCRIIANPCYPLNSRAFHRSAPACRAPDDPSNIPDTPWEPFTLHPDQISNSADNPIEQNVETDVPEADEAPEGFGDRFPRTKERNSSYGSAARRSVRNKKPKELPPITIPDEFLERNVRFNDELAATGDALAIYSDPAAEALASVRKATVESAHDTEPASSSIASRYRLDSVIWNEILATLRAAISLPTSTHAETFPAIKTHLLLQCPKDGSIFFLDSIVDKAALSVGADLIRLDAQDIAEIAGNYMAEKPELSPYTIRSLGYDAQQVVAREDSRDTDEGMEEEEDVDDDEDDESSSVPGRNNRPPFSMPTLSKISAIPIGTFGGNVQDLFKSGKVIFGDGPSNGSRINTFPRPATRNQSSPLDHPPDAKIAGVIAAFFESRRIKDYHRRRVESVMQTLKPGSVTDGSIYGVNVNPNEPEFNRPLIMMIRDFKEIQATSQGPNILSALISHVQGLRRAGQRVVLVGTVSSADMMPSISKAGIRAVQSEHEAGPGRSIIITPERSISQDSIFAEDESRRMREINLRHLQDMVRRRSPDAGKTAKVVSTPDLRLDSSLAFTSGLEESVWPYDRVHRLAMTALGVRGAEEELTTEHVESALKMLHASDDIKFNWANEERQQQKSAEESIPEKALSSMPLSSNKASEDKLKRIRKGCNSHEKKLFSGVINAENIHATFSDVHAPAETVEALKTLTSLSLVRPEAFSYGVLATDKIPGLLLYGPPGTGKTLLAKAVAKESGATVLEVSGSEVYDMYVGEGEKNVKAIFTLAKKLSPCVVFIDEADAIFGSRGGHANRTSHRELINQFLREWDGMNDLSAFIMVATNRPFDLDDAVLRRLPRRLLVDLPVEKDRESILRIHLKNEVLEGAVSLSDLAKRTPFYSGSDLKNLAVAAALACVREEIDVAGKHPADASEPYKFPERRTLAKRHFDRAMEEISASISEDMSSLAAIRKFDEKYGDRRGRRKKRSGYGFGNTVDAEKLETERVRN